MRTKYYTTLKAIAITLALIMTLQATLFITAYTLAARHIRENDPRRSGNLAGTLVFARPKLYRRGQQTLIRQIVEHLEHIGFQERQAAEPGTFYTAGNTIEIRSRLPEFPDAEITIGRGQITAITVERREVDKIEVEPETLLAFMRMVRDERARTMNVRRTVLAPNTYVSSHLYDAVRASEDKNFDSHNGLDEVGMLRSAASWIANGFKSGGSGSTLTQQMVKNVVLKNHNRTLDRKFKEMMLALAAERTMAKEEIFAAYANNCYLGHIQNGPTIIGFAAAARELFDTEIQSLTLAQAATLAAMLDKPEVYLRDARNDNYLRLIARRNRVLSLMERNFSDRYTAQETEQAKAEHLRFVFASEEEPERSLDMISKPFQNFAANQLEQILGDDYQGGNTHIYTTIEPELQIAAHKAVTEQLARLDAMVARARHELSPENRGDEPIQAALVAMDAQSGEILAMVSGRSGEFNFATVRRSPGSAIKPFVYLQAIAEGRHGDKPFTAATIIDPKNDKVDNYRPRSHIGSPATARTLLAHSDNGGAVVAAHDGGLGSTRDLIYKLTDSYSTDLTGMLAIGGAAGCEVSALNLAEGYSVFPNNGVKITHMPLAAVYHDGVKVDIVRKAPTRITDAASAYVVTQMMRSVLAHGGTAHGALSLASLPAEAQIAGKTGTGQIADLWFVGFSKRLIVAVWVGMPNNRPALDMKHGFDGARAALPIWASFLRDVKKHFPHLLEGEFEIPSGVHALTIDPKHGCVTDGKGVTEYFVEGREPEPCSEQIQRRQ